jgi:hypothetical protein
MSPLILSPCFDCQLINQQTLSMSGLRTGLDEGCENAHRALDKSDII